jgi:hypothetical protein
MVELKNISKFFLVLTKAGGQLSRTDLAVKIFGRNWSAKKLDELLASPLLVLLVDSTKEPIRGKGRISLRYKLTPLGWQIARTWKLPVKADRINPEEVQHQFGLLVKDENSWAKNLERDAHLWRQHDEAEKQKRATKAEVEKEWKRLHPGAKKPSAGRKRGNDTTRDGFLRGKIIEHTPIPASVRTPSPTAPTSSPARISAAPPSVPRPAVYDGDGVAAMRGGFRTQPAAPLPAVSVVASPKRSQPRSRVVLNDGQTLDAEDLRILRVASEHMYPRREADSKIQYNNSEWLTPKEWWAKMKNVFE